MDIPIQSMYAIEPVNGKIWKYNKTIKRKCKKCLGTHVEQKRDGKGWICVECGPTWVV